MKGVAERPSVEWMTGAVHVFLLLVLSILMMPTQLELSGHIANSLEVKKDIIMQMQSEDW